MFIGHGLSVAFLDWFLFSWHQLHGISFLFSGSADILHGPGPKSGPRNGAIIWPRNWPPKGVHAQLVDSVWGPNLGPESGPQNGTMI